MLNPYFQQQIKKEQDPYKKKVHYHFGPSYDPDRFLTMKTKRKKDKIATEKDKLDNPDAEKAKEILEKAIFDSRYLIPTELFDELSRLEQELYFCD
jgi:hypothetical protein